MTRKRAKSTARLTSLPVINVTPGVMPLPYISYPVFLDRRFPSLINLFNEIKTGKAPYVFAVMSKPEIEEAPEKFFETGMVCSAKVLSDTEQILLKGVRRAVATTPFKLKDDLSDNYWTVGIAMVQDKNIDDLFVDPFFHKQIQADLIKIKHLLQQIRNEGAKFLDFPTGIIENLINNFENWDFNDKDVVDHFVWTSIASLPELLQKDKQPFLESDSLIERIEMLIELLESYTEILTGHKRGDGDNKDPRDLDHLDNDPKNPKDDEDKIFAKVHSAIKKSWERFKKVREFMNEDAREVAREDIDRLVSYGSPEKNSHEWSKFKRHLDFILDLPWGKETKQEPDISKVEQILEEDHYGLTHVKERICDSIAPKILNPDGRGQITCFVGPPGVGKTSLAKSIARALNRKLVRISVGGIRDESYIRGYDVTYSGSQAGEILREIKRCGAKNPIFVVDEIDKLGHHSTAGDPSSAMLEVLDPEQNYSFKDHYLGCSFDLSKVMFIATANVEDRIILPLHDRMDVIRLPGYLELEKIEIAKRYLIPRWMKEVGLTQNEVQVTWNEESLPQLIKGYTNEAGVRNLDRSIATILRKIARKYLQTISGGDVVKNFDISIATINEILGPVKSFKDKIHSTKVGEAIGLAWTPVGGEVLVVQAKMRPRLQDKKVLARTGMQGEIMKESDEIAMTLLRNKLDETDAELSKKLQDSFLHLHIPEGAVHKDGPSAGITIFMAAFSEVTGRKIRPNLAMTGEIDIKERVKPVGGIREKVVAAERAGIKEIILPKENERNLYDVPDSVKEELHFHFVESVQEAIDIAFEKPE